MYRLLIFFAPMLWITSCQNHEPKVNEDLKGLNHTHDEKHSHDSLHGGANAHMHKTPVKELIQKFESKERDDYQKPEKVLEFMGKISGKTIMDIGAGSGYFSIKLATQGAKVIAADVDDEFQNFLQERIQKEKIKNVELRKIPFDGPALKQEEADYILMVNTFHHIENRKKYFEQVRKGTKKDGFLLVVDYFKYNLPVGPPEAHKLSVDEVLSDLKQAGYSQFEINVNDLPFQYMIKAK